MANYNITNSYAQLSSDSNGLIYSNGGLSCGLNGGVGARNSNSKSSHSKKTAIGGPINSGGCNIQNQNINLSSQQKNPNRNKKVKDLILDLRLQQQQQHQDQQNQLHQHQQQQQYQQLQLQAQHLEHQQQQQQHHHHQLQHESQLIDPYQPVFNNNCTYFSKPSLMQNGQSHLQNNTQMPISLNLASSSSHHQQQHQLDLNNQNSANHLIELNLNSSNYLNLDDNQVSSKLNSSSITLNCLNNTNNNNTDLIQLLNSTNNTIDDCNSLYANHLQHQNHQLGNNNHQILNKTLLDINNHFQNQNQHEQIQQANNYHLNSIHHQQQAHQHQQQQQHLNHHQLATTDDEISSLSAASSISSSSLNHQHQQQHQQNGIHQHNMHSNTVSSSQHHNHLNSLTHDMCGDIVDVICSDSTANNSNNQSNQTNSNDEEFLIYNLLLNKMANPSNSQMANTDKLNNPTSLLLLSSNNEFLNPSSSSSPSPSVSVQNQINNQSNNEKKTNDSKIIDSSEYISLLINNVATGNTNLEESMGVGKPPKLMNMTSCLAEEIENEIQSQVISANERSTGQNFPNANNSNSNNCKENMTNMIKTPISGNATYTTLQPAGLTNMTQSASLDSKNILSSLKQEKFEANFLTNNSSSKPTEPSHSSSSLANVESSTSPSSLTISNQTTIDQYSMQPHNSQNNLITTPIVSSTPNKKNEPVSVSTSHQSKLNNNNRASTSPLSSSSSISSSNSSSSASANSSALSLSPNNMHSLNLNNENMMLMINTSQQHHQNNQIDTEGSTQNNSQGIGTSHEQIPSPTNAQMEELNTKELAHKISSELKRYSIPQAVFAQRVLCRSQGTLSDLLRNPKPWSKLKSGRETFRRMYKWLQEPESQRMNSLRLAAATKRKEDSENNSFTNNDEQTDENEEEENFEEDEQDEDEDDDFMTSGDDNQSTSSPNPSRKSLSILNDSQFQQSSHNAKKPRLVFTDIQRRTLQAIFKETKRPSKEMQVTIAQQLGLEVATVSNFFMNARRRSMDKWKDQDDDNSQSSSCTK